MVSGVNEHFAQYLGIPRTILDIGAHVGELSIAAAERGARRIWAVEADAENYAILCTNVKQYSNIIPILIAVADRSGWAVLYSTIKGNTGMRSIKYKYPQKAFLSSIVGSIELKTLIMMFDEQIDFCKMDIEGAEHSVLMNTPKEYLQQIAWLDLDIHDLNNLDYFSGGTNPQATLDYLDACGFRIIDRQGNEKGYHLMLQRI